MLSIINPSSLTPNHEINWSLFLPEISSQWQEKIEGFNYLGLGGIFLLGIGIFYFFFSPSKFKFKKYRPYFFIVILFPLVALTHRVSFADNLLFEFELPKYLYGLFSTVRASGRLFWPVYYLLFLGSILIVYKNFSKKNSLYILVLLFFLQLADISPGLKKYLNSNLFKKEKQKIDHLFWNNLSEENKILRTTYLNNETHLLMSLKEVLISQKFKSTDISKYARYNRSKASESRSHLYNSFDKGLIEKNTVFVIDNQNHLRNLKYLFKDKNIGFFFRDGVWVFVLGKKDEMTDFDKKELNKYDLPIITEGKTMNLNFNDQLSIHGFGWSHSLNTPAQGIWTEGNLSTLLFAFKNNKEKDYLLKIKLASLSTKKNDPINFSINVNDLLFKKLSLRNISELDKNSITLEIKKGTFDDSTHYIKFEIENPVSPLELLKTPDGRKLGILVESIEILSN